MQENIDLLKSFVNTGAIHSFDAFITLADITLNPLFPHQLQLFYLFIYLFCRCDNHDDMTLSTWIPVSLILIMLELSAFYQFSDKIIQITFIVCWDITVRTYMWCNIYKIIVQYVSYTSVGSVLTLCIPAWRLSQKLPWRTLGD